MGGAAYRLCNSNGLINSDITDDNISDVGGNSKDCGRGLGEERQGMGTFPTHSSGQRKQHLGLRG